MAEQEQKILDLNDWCNPHEAAKILSKNSHKEIKSDYLRKLAFYGKIRSFKLSDRATLYLKEDVDTYIVEDRGEKSGRAKKAASKK